MKKLVLVAIGVALVALPVYKANAFYCCDPWGAVGYAAFVQAGESVITSVTESATNIINSIAGDGKIFTTWNNGMGKWYTEIEKQTAAQKVFSEGDITVNSQFYLQERASEAAEHAVTPAQQSQTIINAMLLAEQSSIVRQKISKNDMDFMADFYAIKATDPTIVIERHKPYCSATDQKRGRCDTIAPSTMQNADIDINTIFNPGDGQYETLSDEERDAALAFVRNVVHPVPEVRLSAQQNGSAQAKEVDSNLLADQAALSVAADSFNSLIANRTRRHQQ